MGNGTYAFSRLREPRQGDDVQVLELDGEKYEGADDGLPRCRLPSARRTQRLYGDDVAVRMLRCTQTCLLRNHMRVVGLPRPRPPPQPMEQPRTPMPSRRPPPMPSGLLILGLDGRAQTASSPPTAANAVRQRALAAEGFAGSWRKLAAAGPRLDVLLDAHVHGSLSATVPTTCRYPLAVKTWGKRGAWHGLRLSGGLRHLAEDAVQVIVIRAVSRQEQ